MALTIPKAELIGVFLESLAYGAYLMVFNQCMFVLRKRRSRPSDYLLGTAVSLFILITAHLVIDILRNMQAFTSDEAEPNYPTTYYGTFDTWQNILKSALYVAVTLVSDAFILYRSFILWGRNYLIITFPFLLFIADIAIGVFWVYTLSLVTPNENVFADALSVRVKTFYSITLAMNVTCTLLIAFKILKIQKAVAPFSKSTEDQISRLVPIIVESGSAYSALLIVMIGTYTSKSPAMFIILNSMSPIIGIVFSSVIVRVGLGLSHGDSHRFNGTTSSSRNIRWMTRASSRPPNSEQPVYSAPFPDGGVQVSLQQSVHTHTDGFPDDVENDISSAHTVYKSGTFHAI
ncbi:hypothetical protein DEU56DRAFT_916999 [Suillus clintonianus]|uniref:uncharacterized protein n=1 Tax=Suillus clintonianus TaxID=1904413 RepID=UPI001B87FB8B|nr:uncharacterized protein DEU56DRAFT_916999 [Suillus clintonianus]KAG2124418.1 hypothetical protein DEU56DRAFT_916999 [Suillus clintonianus]